MVQFSQPLKRLLKTHDALQVAKTESAEAKACLDQALKREEQAAVEFVSLASELDQVLVGSGLSASNLVTLPIKTATRQRTPALGPKTQEVLQLVATGVHTIRELRVRTGSSERAVASRVNRCREKGCLEKTGRGCYELTDVGREALLASPVAASSAGKSTNP